MKINEQQRVFGFDIIRAVAILFVVFSHMRWITDKTPTILDAISSVLGVLGVEIFFVLSGFLIGKQLIHQFTKKDFNFISVKTFWKRRWFRTLPNYFLVLILNILIYLFLDFQLPENTWKYFFFIHNFSSKLPNFFMESWSLSIEEFSYILLPLFLLIFTWFQKNKKNVFTFKLAIILLILLFTLTKLMYYFRLSDTSITFWNINLKTSVIYRLDSIFYGVLAAYFFLKFPINWIRFSNYLLITGITIVLGIHFLIAIKILDFNSNLFFWNVLYFPLNSIGIALTLPYFSKIKTGSKNILKPITFVSITSYSVYLLHNSVILHLMKYFFPSNNLSMGNTIFYGIIYLIITFTISYVLFRFFEKPMTDLRDKKAST